MNVIPSDLPGVMLIEPRVFTDNRGFFLESYSRARYLEAGVDAEFVQDNHSRSVRGTVRGLHYQMGQGQQKLVRCVVGDVYDVVVDIRQGSPTYGQWRGFLLTAANYRQLWVPSGFAHGFSVLSDYAELEYKVDTYYAPELERGIAWDDPALDIDWQVTEPVLSAKDKTLPPLAEADNDFTWT